MQGYQDKRLHLTRPSIRFVPYLVTNDPTWRSEEETCLTKMGCTKLVLLTTD